LRCFGGGRLEPGFALFAKEARLGERIKAAEIVITGEGAIDNSTLMGKGVGELATMCKQLHVPCVALAGVVSDRERAAGMFAEAHALAPDFTSAENAVANATRWLEQLAAKVAADWKGR
jgi:glycerate kinase